MIQKYNKSCEYLYNLNQFVLANQMWYLNMEITYKFEKMYIMSEHRQYEKRTLFDFSEKMFNA